MATPSERAERVNQAQLRVFGEPVTYVAPGAEPVATCAIPVEAKTQQSSAPGYFGDVDVDPAVIAAPAKGDQVVWADGTVYVVARAVAQLHRLTRLVLHRKDDVFAQRSNA